MFFRDIACEGGGPKDIARQLLEDNPDINVMIGGGSYLFYPQLYGGVRLDKKLLAHEWAHRKEVEGKRVLFINNPFEFAGKDFTSVDYLLGKFSHAYLVIFKLFMT